MSGTTIRAITCDGYDPGTRPEVCRAYRYGQPYQTLAEVRESAASEGWDSYRAGRDLCPKHADRRRELLAGADR